MNKTVTSLNIQPQAGVLGVFSRLNYKPWYAIAEFVDNSTQSFYNNEAVLAQSGVKAVTIRIKYDFERNVLTISDDAFGMEMVDFSRAVKVDSPPETTNGRNEFGMGLKTAASWFGNTWSVESTRLGSPNKYYTDIKIDELRAKNLNTIDIISTECNVNEHGTKIIISDVTKRIDASRTKAKIIQLLASMYRRDLNSGKVNIWFNDQSLHFDEYKCLQFRNTKWRKDVEFDFVFNGQKYHVKGFVGILANGGFGRAGFALFRRGRVVIGGEDQNYKPDQIFHQAQSPIAHKLFGEFDLDDFPVNQAKDGFAWDDGLETEFVQKLKDEIKEYIEIAKKTNKERAKEEEFSPKASKNVQEKVQAFANAISNPSLDESTLPGLSLKDVNGQGNIGSAIDCFDEYLENSNNCEEKKVGEPRRYPIQINDVVKKEIVVEWTIGNKQYWINVEDSEDGNEIQVVININHPFFKPYTNNNDFKIVLEKFVISFVLAEQLAKLTSDKEGYIKLSTVRNKMNEFLSKVSEG